MNLGGVSSSLIGVLEKQFVARRGGRDGYGFSVLSTSEVTANLRSRVALILYRIDVDPTRRHIELPPAEIGEPTRFVLGLDLHYLLTVWGTGSAIGEHEVLGVCMEILDARAILSGDDLDRTAPFVWDESDAIKLSLETVSTEDMLRFWDSIDAPYQLSVPYLARTARLGAVERPAAAVVRSRTNVYVPRARP